MVTAPQPAAPPLSVIFRALTHPAVLVGALGYFVDIYDLILFGVVRVPSLKGLGFSGDQLLTEGAWLINVQMAGMLVGGLLWGLLGDWKGRISILFGSIILYSLANVANGYVDGLTGYTICRFFAGLGLAGELGGSITLVSEVLPTAVRGYGTMMVSAIGVLGAVLAGNVGNYFDWRTAYFIGGGLGLTLLILRVAVRESSLFQAVGQEKRRFASQLGLLIQPQRIGRYLACVAIGLPCWYVIGLVVIFSPELAKALGATGKVVAGLSLAMCYTGICLGDLASGALCQKLRSRKVALFLFITATLVLTNYFFLLHRPTPLEVYIVLFLLGFCVGYWAVFVTVAAEHFGTNLRATVATTVPNFSRGSVIIFTSLFAVLKPHLGLLYSGLGLGWLAMAIAFLGLYGLRETFHDDLDYIES